jgi:hypothetical protein
MVKVSLRLRYQLGNKKLEEVPVDRITERGDIAGNWQDKHYH